MRHPGNSPKVIGSPGNARNGPRLRSSSENITNGASGSRIAKLHQQRWRKANFLYWQIGVQDARGLLSGRPRLCAASAKNDHTSGDSPKETDDPDTPGIVPGPGSPLRQPLPFARPQCSNKKDGGSGISCTGKFRCGKCGRCLRGGPGLKAPGVDLRHPGTLQKPTGAPENPRNLRGPEKAFQTVAQVLPLCTMQGSLDKHGGNGTSGAGKSHCS